MNDTIRPVVGATCLGPGSERAAAMLRLIAELELPMCETILYRPDVSLERAREIAAFLDDAASLGVAVLLEPTYEPDTEARPDMCCITSDGKRSSRGSAWGGCCYRNADYLTELGDYIRQVCELYGSHEAVLRHNGRTVIAIGHEMQYQVDASDGHGGTIGAMTCYCDDCISGFAPWLVERYDNSLGAYNAAHGGDIDAFGGVGPPREPGSDLQLWQDWVDYHADAIPDAITLQREVIERELPGALVTHEINDWYPNTWDCVYSGNNFWTMGRRLEHAFNDQYPMEWAPGSLWRIYLYTFTQDVTQSSIGFERSFWTNGQAFAAWQGAHTGTRPPTAGYHEQIYSALIHGANGLIWWTGSDLLPDARDASHEMIRLVEVLGDARPLKDPIALLVPWATHAQTRSETRGDDLMSAYQLLSRIGFQIETIDESQVAAGILEERGYRALCIWGNSSLDPHARSGGMLLADFGDLHTSPFGTVFPETVSSVEGPCRTYSLPDGTAMVSRDHAQALNPLPGCEVVSVFDNDTLAIARYPIGEGLLLRAGTFIGVDYAAGMGVYDWARQERVRIEPAVEDMIREELASFGVVPIASPDNPNVECALFDVDGGIHLLAVNHLVHPVSVKVSVRQPLSADGATDVLTGETVRVEAGAGVVEARLHIDGLGGRAIRFA